MSASTAPELVRDAKVTRGEDVKVSAVSGGEA